MVDAIVITLAIGFFIIGSGLWVEGKSSAAAICFLAFYVLLMLF